MSDQHATSWIPAHATPPDGLSDAVAALLSHPLPPSVRGLDAACEASRGVILTSPATGAPFAAVVVASVDAMDQAASGAIDVMQGEWGGCTASERECLLYRFAGLVESYQRTLAELEALATGRGLTGIQRGVVPELLGWLRYLAGLPTKMDGHTSADPGLLEPFRCSFREPAGVAVLRVSARCSLTERLLPIISALAAGCAVILVCNDQTYPAVYFLCGLLTRAGVPAEAITLLYGDETLEQQLLEHDHFFQPTGARSPGAHYSSRMLVFDDADIDLVVETLLERVLSPLNPSRYTPRIHVHQTIYEELLEAIADRLGRLRLGDPLDPATDFGWVKDEGLNNEGLTAIRKLVGGGGRVVVGNEPGDGARVLAPTLIADDQLCLAHLLLPLPLPLLLVQPFGYEERVVRRANRDRHCQGVSLFTAKMGRIRQLSRQLRTQQIWVNSHFRYEPGDRFDPLGPYLSRRTLWINA